MHPDGIDLEYFLHGLPRQPVAGIRCRIMQPGYKRGPFEFVFLDFGAVYGCTQPVLPACGGRMFHRRILDGAFQRRVVGGIH